MKLADRFLSRQKVDISQYDYVKKPPSDGKTYVMINGEWSPVHLYGATIGLPELDSSKWPTTTVPDWQVHYPYGLEQSSAASLYLTPSKNVFYDKMIYLPKKKTVFCVISVGNHNNPILKNNPSSNIRFLCTEDGINYRIYESIIPKSSSSTDDFSIFDFLLFLDENDEYFCFKHGNADKYYIWNIDTNNYTECTNTYNHHYTSSRELFNYNTKIIHSLSHLDYYPITYTLNPLSLNIGSLKKIDILTGINNGNSSINKLARVVYNNYKNQWLILFADNDRNNSLNSCISYTTTPTFLNWTITTRKTYNIGYCNALRCYYTYVNNEHANTWEDGIGFYVSADAITWNKIGTIDNDPKLYKILYIPEETLFVGVGEGKYTYMSKNGEQWVHHELPQELCIWQIVYIPEYRRLLTSSINDYNAYYTLDLE